MTVPSTAPRSRWRRLAIIAATALAATALPVLAGSAGAASALSIDCSYSPGLKNWIDSGHAPGVYCVGGDPNAGGSGSAHGPVAPGGGLSGTNSGCVPSQNNLPAGFIENATRHDSTSFSDDYDPMTGAGVSTTRNYLNNRLHGSLQIYRSWRDGKASWVLVYSLFENNKVSTATFSSSQPCDTGYWYGEPRKSGAPSGTGDIREPLVGPGLLTTPVRGQLETRGSMTPIPGKADEYFVRVDVTNPTGDVATPATVLAEFGWSFDFTGIVSAPGDVECTVSARAIQECSVPEISPGQNRSILFAAKAKAGVASDADLSVTVSNLGWERTRIEYQPGLTRELNMVVPVTNLYKLTRPAPVVIAATPATPVCASASTTAPGTTALPGTEGDQNVVAGQATKLQRHCSNATALPMSASALHGTTTMDAYGWVTYTPAADYRGADTVSVVTTNPESGAVSAPTTFSVNVVAPAEAKDDAYTTATGVPITTAGSLLDNDRIPPTDGWMIQQGTTPPAHGTLTLDSRSGRFTYAPAAGYVGTDSVRYRLSGPDGAASNVVTVTFTMTAS